VESVRIVRESVKTREREITSKPEKDRERYCLPKKPFFSATPLPVHPQPPPLPACRFQGQQSDAQPGRKPKGGGNQGSQRIIKAGILKKIPGQLWLEASFLLFLILGSIKQSNSFST